MQLEIDDPRTPQDRRTRLTEAQSAINAQLELARQLETGLNSNNEATRRTTREALARSTERASGRFGMGRWVPIAFLVEEGIRLLITR